MSRKVHVVSNYWADYVRSHGGDFRIEMAITIAG
ncbi:MAG: hypothetical protein PWR28_337 [Synergistaceae bacterium]|nr:hypothetical protein [Synergistaceae bacterium]